jgi:5-methylcytosine-specific restriction enzyme subunit McrC
MNLVTLTEHERTILKEAPEKGHLTFLDVERLKAAQKKVGVEAIRWSGHREIAAGSYVGLLSASGVDLEILPKISGLGVGDTRAALIGMLVTAWHVPVHDGDLADHDVQNQSILETLIGLFARRLHAEVRKGLSRAYRQEREELPQLRGRLDTIRQFSTLAARPDRLACQYDAFTSDIPMNRLLLCAVEWLVRQSRRPDTQRLLSEVATHFESVTRISLQDARSLQITTDRMNRRWHIPIRLVQLFISGRYQTAHAGATEGIALLFDMNRLFESFVASLALRVLLPLGYHVKAQWPQQPLALGTSGAAFHTRPDIHIEGLGQVIVMDTKWKHIDPSRPNGDVAQSDAYQMHAYAHSYKAAFTILVYPHHAGIAEAPGLHRAWRFTTGSCTLGILSVDVARPKHTATVLLQLIENMNRSSELNPEFVKEAGPA